MIISDPVQTAVLPYRSEGAFVVEVAVQISVRGSYLPPVLYPPPHTIISDPVQTAVCPACSEGAFVVEVGDQTSVSGLYLPPVLSCDVPPHTIISDPVQTAVWNSLAEGAFVTAVARHEPTRRLAEISVFPEQSG
jgi:hypothetical protein